MKSPSRASRLKLAILAIVFAGCGTSAQSRFYRLDSAATADSAPAVPAAVMVAPVSVPPAVDQPQFVVQVAPNRVEVEEFDRWAAPLDDSIARAVAGDLTVLLGTPTVSTTPLADFNPAYVVTINVQRFESVRGQEALVDAVWAVHKVGNGKSQSGRTIAREPVQGEGFDALAAAHSKAIAKLSSDIASVIRNSASSST